LEDGLRRDIASLAAKPNLPWMTKMMMTIKKFDKIRTRAKGQGMS
jgi:hypothetical protein